uniref:Uncharacterized protein n=1 Tax=Anguilla anguilla TaxID=7936 RepID=A0A0E9XQ80_ANGAN
MAAVTPCRALTLTFFFRGHVLLG